MGNCVIVGINWGDEGKGRMVDLLTQNYDIVIRYQGGGNAGHTVVNEFGSFALHLLPSGIFHPRVVNVLGNNVAVDPENLINEINDVKARGIKIGPENLKISQYASLLMPWHRELDALEEKRLLDKKYGSTKQGIAPFYSDKYQKKTIQVGEILYPERFHAHLQELLEWKNLVLEGVYHAEPYTMEMLEEWYEKYCLAIKPFICNTIDYLKTAKKENKKIMFEAQLGALRDIDFGIYPYTTSSNTIASYAPVGAGCPFINIDEVIGIVKAYSTCVGEGPFVSELFDKTGDKLREIGQEYGAKTGRPRRIGALDLVATKYGVEMQNATALALTKLDVLSYFDEIPVCVAYEINNQRTTSFPFNTCLDEAKPVIINFKGWNKDISHIKKYEDLPKEAREYIEYIEQYVLCPIRYISVGPERESYIERKTK